MRSCVPPAATEPSASCAAPARTGEFVTTSLGSAPVLLDGWWVLLILTQALELDIHSSLSQLMCLSQALTISKLGQHLLAVHSTCTVWDLPPSLEGFQKHLGVAPGDRGCWWPWHCRGNGWV